MLLSRTFYDSQITDPSLGLVIPVICFSIVSRCHDFPLVSPLFVTVFRIGTEVRASSFSTVRDFVSTSFAESDQFLRTERRFCAVKCRLHYKTVDNFPVKI